MSYSTIAQMYVWGLPQRALAGVPIEVMQEALDGGFDTINSYLRDQFELPLKTWGRDIRRVECQIAAWDLLSTRGLPPGGADMQVVEGRKAEAIRWLELISLGKVIPDVTDSSFSAEEGVPAAGPELVSDTGRGFSRRGIDPQSGGGFTDV